MAETIDLSTLAGTAQRDRKDGNTYVVDQDIKISDAPIPSPESPASKETVTEFVEKQAGLEVKNGARSPDFAVELISNAIVDPIVFVKSGGGSGSGSDGACSTGFSLAAAVAAVAVMRRRK